MILNIIHLSFDNNQLRKMTDKPMNEAFATVDQKLAEIISESIHE